MLASLTQRYPILKQFYRFVLIGFLNTGLDFFILNLEMRISEINSGPFMLFQNAVSFSLATINSFFLNKKWSFEDSSDKSQGKKLSQFFAVSLIGLVINSFIVFLITTYIPSMFGLSDTLWANLAKVVATGFSLIWNFFGYKFIVFHK